MKIVVLLGVALTAAVLATSAAATAPPIGPLPKGPITSIQVEHGQLFALALPKPASGYTRRGAKNTNVKVAKPFDEGELNGNIVLVYKALKAGKTNEESTASFHACAAGCRGVPATGLRIEDVRRFRRRSDPASVR